MYDYLVVGSGLFGCVFANIATSSDKKCIVIDKRSKIGGNCSSKNINGIEIHEYGSHIFNTNDVFVWLYINKFGEFVDFKSCVKSYVNGILYSFPINLSTLNQLFGISSPDEAKNRIYNLRCKIENPKNFEEACLAKYGTLIYEKFFKGFSEKHWGKSCKKLPFEIVNRLPLRFICDDRYWDKKYVGFPVNGYTKSREKMVERSDVELNMNIFKEKKGNN